MTDTAGFATTRLGLAIGLEAMRMAEENVATPEDIDFGMNLRHQHAVGPLHTTDMVGLDVRLAIAEHMEREFGPRFTPPQILRDMVEAGKLGQKTGGGFFVWRSEFLCAPPRLHLVNSPTRQYRVSVLHDLLG
ncbi:3-hydroxyacyl-CoA dehydrogenase family protein [Leucobacter manosquensis]|uniref:3-hydroxyacyl-CoA dehydrogenase C-terminal domain-containing protein n=1 Tax=Leucobacter manosquensis TaxID=2810611 RepID=A0ABS5M5L3_9MICO|nr:hypothetical protein [Leucobacter manosquensis]